jgi:hypothetical protein
MAARLGWFDAYLAQRRSRGLTITFAMRERRKRWYYNNSTRSYYTEPRDRGEPRSRVPTTVGPASSVASVASSSTHLEDALAESIRAQNALQAQVTAVLNLLTQVLARDAR